MQLNVFCKDYSWHTSSVRQYEDIWPFRERIFSAYLLWTLLCQDSSTKGSGLSDLRASWRLPPARSCILTVAKILIDSISPDQPQSVSFPGFPEVLAHLYFPRSLASYFLLSPQHPPHFLPLEVLALFFFLSLRVSSSSSSFFFNRNEFILPVLKKKTSVVQEFYIHSLSTCLSVIFVVLKSHNLNGFHCCPRKVVLKLFFCKHQKRTHKKEDNNRCNRGCGLVLAAAPESCSEHTVLSNESRRANCDMAYILGSFRFP